VLTACLGPLGAENSELIIRSQGQGLVPPCRVVVFRLVALSSRCVGSGRRIAALMFSGDPGNRITKAKRTHPNPISIRGRFHNMSQCLHQPAQSCSLLFSAIQSKPTRCGRLVS